MNTTREYLIEVKKKNNLSSDYALAKLLGTTRSAIRFYMKGERIMDDATCLKVAEALNLNPLEIIAGAGAGGARAGGGAGRGGRGREGARGGAGGAGIV